MYKFSYKTLIYALNVHKINLVLYQVRASTLDQSIDMKSYKKTDANINKLTNIFVMKGRVSLSRICC